MDISIKNLERIRKMDARLADILASFIEKIIPVYREKLKSIVLFGSCARGTYTEDSDIDLFLVMDIDENKVRDMADSMDEKTYEVNDAYDVLISPVLATLSKFSKYGDSMPLYINIKREGMVIYER